MGFQDNSNDFQSSTSASSDEVLDHEEFTDIKVDLKLSDLYIFKASSDFSNLCDISRECGNCSKDELCCRCNLIKDDSDSEYDEESESRLLLNPFKNHISQILKILGRKIVLFFFVIFLARKCKIRMHA